MSETLSFSINRELKEKYPGINLKRLKDDFESYLERGVPLSQIIQTSFFMNSNFHITKDVLTPRFETEILVELAVEELKKIANNETPLVVDIGTGSGAIIISALQMVDRKINAIATDISKEALSIAKRNFFNLRFSINADSTLEFQLRDRLDGFNKQVNLIVTNPPYIKKTADRKDVHDQVHTYEPHLALYLDDDKYELWFYDFFVQAYSSLKKDGVLLMEGHEDHLKNLAKIAEDIGFTNIKIIKDYTRRDRFIKAVK